MSWGNSTTKARKSMILRSAFDLAQIHINGIGHGLEGIEADTQRQYKADGGKAETKQRIEIAHKEVGVLEESQHTEIEHYGIDQSQPTDQLIIPMGFDQTWRRYSPPQWMRS